MISGWRHRGANHGDAIMLARTKRTIAAIICTAAVAASPAALADMVTFTIQWKPSDPNGTFLSSAVSAVATLTMDTKYINQPGPDNIPMADVQSLSLTIGNDTFGKSNFDSLRFNYGHQLIYSGEMIGQYTGQTSFGDFTGPYGTMIGQGGVFNLNGNGSTLGNGDVSPVSIQAFVMSTNGAPWVDNGLTHSIMRVSSMIATWDGPSPVSAVPEADTYALLLAGLGITGWMARRKRTASARR
jgi:hypothetical protein